MSTLSAALEARDEPTYDDASQTLLDALDWITKALPYLKTKAIDLLDDIEFMERVYRDEQKSNEWKMAQEWRKELEPITALIAQAEGKEVGE